MTSKFKTIKSSFQSCGYPCHIIEIEGAGHLCGYVGVDKSHPLFGEHYNDLLNLDVHGGVTFTNHRDKGKNKGLWWIGMDCGHTELGDVIPHLSSSPIFSSVQGLYAVTRMLFDGAKEESSGLRSVRFVTKELKKLARQIKAAETRTVSERGSDDQ